MQPQMKYAAIAPTLELGSIPTDGVDTPQVQYTEAPMIQDQYTPAESNISFGEAMWYSWRYDSMVNAVANRLARPNVYDNSYVESGKREAMINDLKGQYGSNFNASMLETAQEISSQEEEDWFRETVNNKMLAEQAWDDHAGAYMLGNLFAPENFLMGWLGGFAKAAKATTKLYGWLDRAITSKGAQTLLYGSGVSAAAGAQAVPGVLWNYDPETAIPIAMAMGGAIGVGLASRVDPNKFIQKVADQPANKNSLKPNGIFGVRVSELLSLADELDELQPGLGSRTVGNAGKGIRNDIDSAGSRSASLQARASIHLNKLEQGFKKLGLANKGLVENIKQAIGLPSTVTKLEAKEVSRSTQRVQAYLGNMYNYNASMQIRNDTIKELQDEIATHEAILGLPLQESVGTVQELAAKVNALRQAVYKKELADYQANKKDVTKLVTDKEPIEPAKYTPPMASVVNIVEPDINNLTELERGMVQAYYDSGIAEYLGKMVNEQGKDIRTVIVDKNYFHTRFNTNKMDEVAERIAADVVKARHAEADLKEQELNLLYQQKRDADISYSDAKAYHTELSEKQANTPSNSNEFQILGELLSQAKRKVDKSKNSVDLIDKHIKDNEDFIKRIRGSALKRSKNARMKEAYIELFGIMGEQMAEAIEKCTGTAVDAHKVGAFLAMKQIPDVGHQAMRDALLSLQLDNERKLAELILEVGGDLDINNKLLKALDAENGTGQENKNGTGLENLIKQATELHSVNNLKLVGEASAFKSRFFWDYNRKSKAYDIALNELLNDDFLNTATRNIQEECGRVALSHVYMKTDTGSSFYLNSGANITRAQNMIHDLAVGKGYGDKAATDLATMTFDALLGRATGEQLGPRMQVLTQIAQMVQLKNSGLYNIVDTVNVAHVFGTTEVIKHFIPAIKQGLTTEALTKKDAQSLKDIVSRMYAMEARIRPDLVVLSEDMTDATKTPMARGVMNSAQYMRWFNGQAQVAQWQANMCSSLYEEALIRALRDDDWDMLERAGHTFTPSEIKKMRKEFDIVGLDVDQWEDSVLAEKVIRNCFDVTTNTALQVRRGDKPRFLNTNIGKICFAYQSFVWAANNKLTRRFMNDYGMLGATTFLAKQLPLAALMAVSVQALSGKDPFADEGALVNSVINAWSGLGLVGWAGSFLSADIGGTAPGLGLLNTARNGVTSLVTNGDPTGLIKNVPLLGGFLPYRMAIAALCGTMDN